MTTRRHSRKVLCLLSGFIYLCLVLMLLAWIKHLQGTPRPVITTAKLNESSTELIIQGQHLTSEISASLTPNRQRRQTTLSSIPIWDNVFDFVARDDQLWLATSRNGLLHVNTKDPTRPFIEGAVTLPGRAWRMALYEKSILVAGANSGLFGVDLSGEQPKLAFSMYSDRTILDVAAAAGIAIAVAAQHGVFIVDIQQHGAPRQLVHLPLAGNLQAVTLQGNIAYVTGTVGRQGILHCLDLSTPAQPRHLATVALCGPGWDCTVMDELLIVAMGTSGLCLFDVKNPAEPIRLPTSEDNRNAFNLSARGDDLLVASGTMQIFRYLKRGSQLHYRNSFLTAAPCRTILHHKNFAVAEAGREDISFLDLDKSGATFPQTINLSISTRNTSNILHDNGIIAVNTGRNVLLFRNTAKQQLQTLTTLEFEEIVTAMALDSQFIYIAQADHTITVHDLDTAQPAKPRAILHSSSRIKSLQVSATHLYISQPESGVFALDLRDIDQPRLHPVIAAAHQGFYVAEPFAYLATQPGGYHRYRLQGNQPALPGTEFAYPLPIQQSAKVIDLAIQDGYAFAAIGAQGILSLNLQDSERITIGDSLDLGGFCSKITLHNNYAYVTVDHEKVKMVDIANPDAMRIVCEFPATLSVAIIDGGMLELSENGITTSPLKEPLPLISQRSGEARFSLPGDSAPGYYDLQLASDQGLVIHSDLYHYSPQNGWRMTRPLEP